jgi:hypothetical protein
MTLFASSSSSRAALLTCALLGLLCACEGSTTVTQVGDGSPDGIVKVTPPKGVVATPTPLKPAFEEASMAEHIAVNTQEKGTGPLSPEALDATRKRHRLDIDQLDASIRQVTGGIGWTEQRGSQEINLFEDLADTLGKPDYIDSTQEDLSPNLIFMKFLNDAARQVCDRLSEREVAEYARLGKGARHLFILISPTSTEDADIDANIQELMLRFHGTYAQPDSPEFRQWRWLFDSSLHVAEKPSVAWRTVCVGLMTHPDFYSY